MKSVKRAALAAGVTALFMAVGPFGGEAEAEPVVSSWYGPGFEGSMTASGEVYEAGAHTAAHPSLPFGTELLVTYGGRQAVVRVNDRGPYAGGRGLDLSRAAAEEIGLVAVGADAVDVRAVTGSGDTGYVPRDEGYVVRRGCLVREKDVPREDRDVVFPVERRPYLKVLGAVFTPYSMPSTRDCQEASMVFSPTSTVPQTRLPSVESMRTQAVEAVARCSSGMRTGVHRA